jgi:hypothetical protein
MPPGSSEIIELLLPTVASFIVYLYIDFLFFLVSISLPPHSPVILSPPKRAPF